MTEKPIIFSAPMVQAILAGRKTQTRRIITPRANGLFDPTVGWTDDYILDPGNAEWREQEIRYHAGDVLWVRENWRTFISLDAVKPSDLLKEGRGAGVLYEADGGGMSIDKTGERRMTVGVREDHAAFGKLRPSIFLPRAFSRITLDLNDVRVQRLQDISEDDALAEGMPPTVANSPRIWFMSLWNIINGFGAWDANPWVEALTFPAFPPKAPV